MFSNAHDVYARSDNRIKMDVYTGHFATPQSHITHYLDITKLKSRLAEATTVAKTLGAMYNANTIVDTIVCMDGLEVLGTLLARDLTNNGIHCMNQHQTIYIVSPEYSNAGQMIFRDNIQPMIRGKHVLILNGSITTGGTLTRAVNSVNYYGGHITGICSIFSLVDEIAGMEIKSIFDEQDIPNYETYHPYDCPMCKANQKIDAMVNGFGYSRI